MHNNVSLSGGVVSSVLGELLIHQCIAQWKNYSRNRRYLELTASGRYLLQRYGAQKLADALLVERDAQELLREKKLSSGKKTLVIDGVPHIVSMHHSENPLAWLARHRDRFGNAFLSAREIEAGERFRSDMTAAHFLPHVTMQWDRVISHESYNPKNADSLSERVVAAKRRLNQVMKYVGPDFGELLMDVCGFLKGLETVERERNWPSRSAKTILKMALHKAADHYKLDQRAVGPQKSLGIQAYHCS
jgi:hypothetical protein